MRKKFTQTRENKVGLGKKSFFFFSNVYAFSCCMGRSSLFFFSGDEVSEKVTISRNFKERVVQPILKVNIPLAINCNKRGKHFLSDKLQQTGVLRKTSDVLRIREYSFLLS